MSKTAGIAILSLLVAGAAVPAGAQPLGMDAMKYYVGTWTCVGGPVALGKLKSTATFTLDGGVLREWHTIPAQAKMTQLYTFSTSTSYDAKGHRYVSAFLDNEGGWELSTAKAWTGNTEQWSDVSTDSGKLGHAEVVRTKQNAYSITGYETKAATKPSLEATCNRSS